jgi:hypothetical protein
MMTFSWDKQADFVAAIYADQRQTNAGVAGSGFDDGATGFQFAVLFGAANDADGRPIFYAAPGVEVFELGEDVGGSRRNQPFQLKHGGFADQLSNVVGDAQAGHF